MLRDLKKFNYVINLIPNFNGDPEKLENFVYKLREIPIKRGWNTEYDLRTF